MMRNQWRLAVLGVLLGTFFLLPACGDDDPARPGNGGGDPTAPDTTPPLVVSISPANNENDVAFDEAVVITFNEAMDQASHTDQITLSSGTITAMSWTTAQILTVAHDGWDEGVAVTMTVGTGLSDVAGNELADPFSITFYTASSELVFLSSIPPHGAVDVNRSSRIELLFSTPMNAVSLADNLTLRDGDLSDLPFSVSSSDGDWIRVTPDGDLPADATITVTVDAGAEDMGGRPLADPVSISFTTSDEVDMTPPTILSIAPPSGGTIPAGTSAMIVTFSEPMDPNSVQPPEMGAELWWLIASQQAQPVWSQDYTVLTIGLPAPLPAGMPLWITFAGYADANGNVQHDETHWSVVVAGATDYYPVIDGRELTYFKVWEEGEVGETDPTDWGTSVDYSKFELQTGGIFHLVEYENEDYQEAHATQIMSRTATDLRMHGWIDHEDDGDQRVDFNVPLIFLRLPPVQGQVWSSSTGSPQAPPGGLIAADGEWVAFHERLAASDVKGGPVFYWTSVWEARVEYSMSAGDTTMQSGTETMYLAPGIGIVKTVEEGLDHEEGTWDWRDRRLVIPSMR